MKVEIRDGNDGDWVDVLVDGEPHYEGHSVPDGVWVALLRRAGADVVTTPGNFCDCGEWAGDAARCADCVRIDG